GRRRVRTSEAGDSWAAAATARPSRAAPQALPLGDRGALRYDLRVSLRSQDPTMIEPRDRVRHPALLVVDMQNDFVRVGAALEVADARATIPANKALIEF